MRRLRATSAFGSRPFTFARVYSAGLYRMTPHTRRTTSGPGPDDVTGLMAAARSAARFAYCPYSGTAVGAAVAISSGEVFSAANVENASYSATICAERNAATQAIVRGHRDLVALALYTPTAEPWTPCGTCRQFLAEFNPRMLIVCVCDSDDERRFTLDELLPEGFGPTQLAAAESPVAGEAPAGTPSAMLELVLQPTYYHSGFFNVHAAHARLLGADGEAVTLHVPGRSQPIRGTIDRTTDETGTPRIVGGTELRDWFQSVADVGQVVGVTVRAPNAVALQPLEARG